MSRGEDRAKGHALIQQLESTAGVEILFAEPALFREGLERHAERPDKEWSLTDCISFVVMEQRSIRRALAYDRHFEQAGFEALLRGDP